MIENEEDIYTKLDPTILELERMTMISFGGGDFASRVYTHKLGYQTMCVVEERMDRILWL